MVSTRFIGSKAIKVTDNLTAIRDFNDVIGNDIIEYGMSKMKPQVGIDENHIVVSIESDYKIIYITFKGDGVITIESYDFNELIKREIFDTHCASSKERAKELFNKLLAKF